MLLLRFLKCASLCLLLGCALPVVARDKPLVVTTTTMIADLTAAVGADAVEVYGLMGPGVDPHLYRATASDIRRLRGADLIVYNGLMLEGRLGDVLARVEQSGKPVVALAEWIPVEQLIAVDDSGQWDPHIWFHPLLWRQCVDRVVEALSALEPTQAEAFSQRGEQYKQMIDELYVWGQKLLQSVEPEQRVLITSHDAFGYFGVAFDFEVVGLQGISTASEAGLADIAAVSDFIRSRRVPAVFIESSVSPAAIERLAKDAGVQIGGELFSDATGSSGEMETAVDGSVYDVGTWNGMFRHNLNAIAVALGNEATLIQRD